MKGIDVHMSQHIGKKFSALFETLTTLTEDEREMKDEEAYLETGTGELIVGATAAAASSNTAEAREDGSTVVTLALPQDLASPAVTPVDEQQPVTQAQSVVLPSILVDGMTRKKSQQHKVKINEDALFDGGGLQQLRSVSPAAEAHRDARRKMLESQISEQGENINTLKQVGREVSLD